MEKSPRWRGRARRLLSGEASGYPWPRSASLQLERSSEERTEPSKRELPLPDAASAEFSPAVAAAALIFQLVPTVAESAKGARGHFQITRTKTKSRFWCPAKNRPVLTYIPSRTTTYDYFIRSNKQTCVCTGPEMSF